jgi:hypothetical protein
LHIIILEGKDNSGKTTTLKMVYEFLKILNANVEDGPNYIDDSDIGDFQAVLSFQNKLVAIFTKGDKQKDCYNAIDEYSTKKYAIKKNAKRNVDVLIIAHNSKFSQLKTKPHTSVIVKKKATRNKLKELSLNIGDCLNIIIKYTQHCPTQKKI